MGLGQFFKSIFGKKTKKFESPDVTFIEDEGDGVTHTIPITITTPTQQIIIKNNDEYLVYRSKDDIPKELLKEMEDLDELDTVDSFSVIVDGQRQIFNHFEDIPEEVRKAIKDLEEK